MTRYRKTFREAMEEVNTLQEAQYKYDGKVVFISKKEFAKVSKDYKNATPGQERMVVLDPKSQATVSAPVKFTEDLELGEGYEKVVLNTLKKAGITGAYFSGGRLIVSKSDMADVKKAIQDEPDIIKAPTIVAEQIEESFSDAQIAKLKKEYEPLRGKRISVDNANKLGAMFTKFDKDKNALEKLYGGDIPFISTMAMTRLMTKHNYTASKFKALRKEELEILEEVNIILEGQGTISGFRNDKEKDNLISLAKQHGLKTSETGGKVTLSGNMRKILDIQLAMQKNGLKAEGKMSDIDAMQKAGKSAAEIAKAMGLDVKTVKSILGEEVDENAPSTADMDRLKKMGMKPKKEEGEDKEKLKSEIDKKDQEIAMLKQKAETEKAKVAKKETEKMVNPETGEPLLQVGIAYKHLRDKMKKESTDAEKSKAYAIGMSVAKKKYNDEPPLEKKTIKKAHEIGDKILKKEGTMIGGIVTDNSGKKMPGYDKAKKSLKDFMSKPQPAKGASDKVMSFIFDDELLDDLYSAEKKKTSDVRPLVKKRLKQLGIKEDNSEHPAKEMYEQIKGLKNKAEKSGMPYGILKKVYDRGMAAWRGGHRPGASQQQWAFARVNSFITKSSGTWGGADKDLAAKVRGSK